MSAEVMSAPTLAASTDLVPEIACNTSNELLKPIPEDDNVLSETVMRQNEQIRAQEERIKELELNLNDARKLIKNREDLLAAVQWKPKADYYVWKNPTINDKTVRDAQERKLKTLLEQMRVMEKCLAERDQIINSVVMEFNSPAPSADTSPFGSPMGSFRDVRTSPAMQPGWNRSPADSPAVLKSSWWSAFSRKSTSMGNSSGGINSSTGLMKTSVGSSGSTFSPETPKYPSLASSSASPANARASPVPNRAAVTRSNSGRTSPTSGRVSPPPSADSPTV